MATIRHVVYQLRNKVFSKKLFLMYQHLKLLLNGLGVFTILSWLTPRKVAKLVQLYMDGGLAEKRLNLM
jgi:hypothetical protein